MADYFVSDTQAAAQAICDAIWNRYCTLMVAQGCGVDANGVIGKRNGVPDPSAQRTVRWDAPQQRLDGKWISASPDGLSTTVGAYLCQDVLSATVAPLDPSWLAVTSGVSVGSAMVEQ